MLSIGFKIFGTRLGVNFNKRGKPKGMFHFKNRFQLKRMGANSKIITVKLVAPF